jgi:hypothetical protein
VSGAAPRQHPTLQISFYLSMLALRATSAHYMYDMTPVVASDTRALAARSHIRIHQARVAITHDASTASRITCIGAVVGRAALDAPRSAVHAQHTGTGADRGNLADSGMVQITGGPASQAHVAAQHIHDRCVLL